MFPLKHENRHGEVARQPLRVQPRRAAHWCGSRRRRVPARLREREPGKSARRNSRDRGDSRLLPGRRPRGRRSCPSLHASRRHAATDAPALASQLKGGAKLFHFPASTGKQNASAIPSSIEVCGPASECPWQMRRRYRGKSSVRRICRRRATDSSSSVIA